VQHLQYREEHAVMDKLSYSVDEAADLVGICRSRLYEEIRKKKLTALKSGKRTLITAAEIQRWLSALPVIGAK
jgi:excisionase family DNA binding protein